jgi:hypothetical protein
MLSYIKTPKAIVLNIDGEPFNIRSNHKNYERILKQVKVAHTSQDERDVEELKLILKPINRLIYNDEYKIDVDEEGNLYLGGIEEMIPTELSDYIKEAVECRDNIESLVNFCRLLMLNPDPRVRQQLFSFLQHNGHPITRHGYFVAYKYVSVKEAYISVESNEIETVEEDVDGLGTVSRTTQSYKSKVEVVTDKRSVKGNRLIGYSEIITNAREKSRKAKQSAKRYFAFINDNNEHDLIFKFFPKTREPKAPLGYKFLGEDEGITLTLDELYSDLMNFDASTDDFDGSGGGTPTDPKGGVLQRVKQQIKSTTFTDTHTRTMDIKLGDVVSMPRADCDPDPNNTCSSGLHVGSMDYVGGCDLILNCLISPEDVVSVPVDYNNTKMRCCKYFAFSINHEEYKKKYTDVDYHEMTKQELQKRLEDKVEGDTEKKVITSIVSESKVIA